MRADIDIIKQYIEAKVTENYILIKAIEAVNPNIKDIDLYTLAGPEKLYILEKTHSPNTSNLSMGERNGAQISKNSKRATTDS